MPRIVAELEYKWDESTLTLPLTLPYNLVAHRSIYQSPIEHPQQVKIFIYSGISHIFSTAVNLQYAFILGFFRDITQNSPYSVLRANNIYSAAIRIMIVPKHDPSLRTDY
jgi:hypothetical protein